MTKYVSKGPVRLNSPRLDWLHLTCACGMTPPCTRHPADAAEPQHICACTQPCVSLPTQFVRLRHTNVTQKDDPTSCTKVGDFSLLANQPWRRWWTCFVHLLRYPLLRLSCYAGVARLNFSSHVFSILEFASTRTFM